MSRSLFRWFVFAALVGLLGRTASAQEVPKTEAAKAKLPTAKAEKGVMKTDVSFKGVFEAPEMAEVQLKPEVWGSFPVLKAVDAGAKVREGDVLIEFDPEKIDKAIRDQESDQRIAELSLKMAELDLPVAERTNPLDLASAERQLKQAREDFDRYQRQERQLQIDSVKFGLKAAEQALENEREELKQLEKMYRSKDLTEETEEIVLKRQRFSVEQAEHMVRTAKNRTERTLDVDLPRRERDMRDNLERAEIAWAKARYVIPMSLEQKRYGLEKAKYERARAKEKFDNLKKDRLLFTVKAPADGVVYYGKCVQGNWTGSATKLQKGGTVLGDEVFMTVIKPGRLFIRAGVDEKDSRAIAAGNPARVTAPALPDAKLAGEIDKVAPVPVGGSYEVKVKLNGNDAGAIPGMTAMVKVTTYENKDAVTVPSAAVFADDGDEDKSFVYKVADGGKPEKATVKVGKRSGGKAEILDGLEPGDEITLSKPEGGKDK